MAFNPITAARVKYSLVKAKGNKQDVVNGVLITHSVDPVDNISFTKDDDTGYTYNKRGSIVRRRYSTFKKKA